MTRLVLGTRGSALALWQARHVAQRLRALHPDLELTETIIKTEGDRSSGWIGETGGRGVFVLEIEQALLEKRIDLAVHSMKDLPTRQPDGLRIVAVPERHAAGDLLLSAEGFGFDELPRGAVLATGSFRRRCQLLHARPDLAIVPVRGNVPTRIAKLSERKFDALVLARAGVERLGLDSVPSRPIPESVCLPAVGQGALALEVRSDDAAAAERIQPLDHEPTSRAVAAERAFLRRLGGGCLAPATAYAVIEGPTLTLRAIVGDADGRTLLRDEGQAPSEQGVRLGEAVAERMIAAGAEDLLIASRDAASQPPAP